MFMRFTGEGISYLSMWESTQGFEDEIWGLWGTIAVLAFTDDLDDSDKDLDLDVQVIDAANDSANSNPESDLESLDLEDATFVSYEDEMLLGKKADLDTWYTDKELELGSEKDVQVDDRDCYSIEDKSCLGYELP